MVCAYSILIFNYLKKFFLIDKSGIIKFEFKNFVFFYELKYCLIILVLLIKILNIWYSYLVFQVIILSLYYVVLENLSYVQKIAKIELKL